MRQERFGRQCRSEKASPSLMWDSGAKAPGGTGPALGKDGQAPESLKPTVDGWGMPGEKVA